MLYSEEKDNYLPNIGYLGEQPELYLASKHIRVCDQVSFNGSSFERPYLNGLSFVIMLAIAKMEGDRFRKDMFKSKRKRVEEIWSGE